MTRDLPVAAAIVLASFLIGLMVNFFSPKGIALKGQWDKEKGVIFARGKDQNILPQLDLINPLEVKKIVAASSMTIVDVRPDFAYEEGHIPGAVSYPLKDFDNILKRFTATYQKDTPLLLYCASFACTDAHHAASILVEKGFSKVRVFTGGFQEWQEMGFSVEESEKP